MGTGSPDDWPLPEHPQLRGLAEELEAARRVAEIFDAKWRLVYISRELASVIGAVDPRPFLGLSSVQRDLEHPEIWGFTPDALRAWWKSEVPYMRSTLEPGTEDFSRAFGGAADAAAAVEPEEVPLGWGLRMEFRHSERLRYSGTQQLVTLRLNDTDGGFLGALRLSWPALSGSVTGLLSRGDVGMYERLAQKADPARRPAAVLFVDLEASGEIAKTLPSTAYFQLIRDLTTIVDDSVAACTGIVGKHAGDGASAFFLAEDFDRSETAAAVAAVRAARTITDGVGGMRTASGAPIAVNTGIHWGSMLVIGQVVTSGRLEVTALGDEVNEAARIQDVAEGGTILASKHLLERIPEERAAELGIDSSGLTYRTLAQLEGAGDKAVRDAGAIPVAPI
ncbi:MAG: adenylate/guanylate cyclase domain-containing protein [Solirubrobacterales bacterium]|nr:adenylate/guanylate cyclase domain-containing protein [Solirubrobacterales bacterium]